MLNTNTSAQAVTNGVLTTASGNAAWRVGTLLEALVLPSGADGATRLQIGNQTVVAHTSLALQNGDKLRLHVSEIGRSVVLRTETPTPQADAIRNGIRETLPRQTAQTPLLASVLTTVNSRAVFPPELLQVIEAFSTQIRPAATLTDPQGLKTAISESGTFLERNVLDSARSAPIPGGVVSGDWKAALLQLRNALLQLLTPTGANTQTAVKTPSPYATASSPSSPRSPAAMPAPVNTAPVTESAPPTREAPAPPLRQSLPVAQAVLTETPVAATAERAITQLLAQSDGALARIRLNQLASVTPATEQKTVWLLELPVRHDNSAAEVVTLRIEREPGDAQEAQDETWTVQLVFDLGVAGTLRSRVVLQANRIYTAFQTDREQARKTVSGRLSELRAAMQKQEIDVACLSCVVDQTTPAVATGSQLLSERA